MKKNWIKKIIGGVSLTSALFVFQACYGTPQDFGLDFLVEGQVKSKNAGLPINGIKVSVAENQQYVLTDENGRFSFYTQKLDSVKILFEDVDSTVNKPYSNKDTVLTNIADKVFLEVNLDEK